MNISISVFHFVCITYLFIGIIISSTILFLNLVEISEELEIDKIKFRDTFRKRVILHVEENFTSMITLIFLWFPAICVITIKSIYDYKKLQKRL